jgi:hypothetical protein
LLPEGELPLEGLDSGWGGSYVGGSHVGVCGGVGGTIRHKGRIFQLGVWFWIWHQIQAGGV